MSRAMNLALAEAVVRQRCGDSGVSISAIESLPAGGTRLVCTTGDGADEIRLRLKDHLIPGPVRQFAFSNARSD